MKECISITVGMENHVEWETIDIERDEVVMGLSGFGSTLSR
jgi:hypothetical protein